MARYIRHRENFPSDNASSSINHQKYEKYHNKEVDECTSDSSEEESEDEFYSTPDLEKQDRKRWKYLLTLSPSVREKELEKDAIKAVERDYKEHLFTNIISDFEFELIRPFGHNPLYETVKYPVDEKQMEFIKTQIHYYWHRKLNTRIGFIDFGRHFDFQGTEYRKTVLMKHARNRVFNEDFEKEDEEMNHGNEDVSLDFQHTVELWLENNQPDDAHEIKDVDRISKRGKSFKRPLKKIDDNYKEKSMNRRRMHSTD